MEEKTVVIFRKFKCNGDIIAIFPFVLGTNNPYTCSSYEHVGQHGSCDPKVIVQMTTLATPDEYDDLKTELEIIGYTLNVYKRIPATALAVRRGEMLRYHQERNRHENL